MRGGGRGRVGSLGHVNCYLGTERYGCMVARWSSRSFSTIVKPRAGAKDQANHRARRTTDKHI